MSYEYRYTPQGHAHEAVASRAMCECGWVGPVRMAKIDARADAGDHNLRARR